MSKRKGHRKKRRKRAAQARKATRPGLLGALADALNACETAGMRPRFTYGIVFTEFGVIDRKKGRWVARPFTVAPGAPPAAVDDLDD